MPIKAEFPEKLGVLFEPKRYKILWGGRGGAKSWGAARALLLLGKQKPLRILCAREIQHSIQESVHQLLKDQIIALNLQGHYDVLNTEIRGKNGTLIVFAGLKHNINNIKSKEGLDIVWVEEAQTVSKASWETLIPTIRAEGSEIWVTFNPELDTDETYKRFVLNPPRDAVVIKVNYDDNKWFPSVLRQEMEELKERDFDAYLTIWEGHCKAVLDGAIYANEMRQATQDGRFTRVPYSTSIPVHTFWDLGRRDKTAIWFVQQVGFEFRFIDYYENRGYALAHYIKHLKDKPYIYGEVWLPHDAENDLLASELTVAQQIKAHNFDVKVTAKIGVSEGIEAARSYFSRCWFDEEKCADGIQCLRRYRYELNENTGLFSKQPLHDDASHGADAFRGFAVSMEEASPTKRPGSGNYASAGGWMG
jgi:phage terminase large subunit